MNEFLIKIDSIHHICIESKKCLFDYSLIKMSNQKDCKDCDCNQYACELCDATWNPGKPCTGVIGAATTNQSAPATFAGADSFWNTGNSQFTYGKNSAFHKKDNNNPCYNEKTKKLGLYDTDGNCIPGSLGKNPKILQTGRLVVDGRRFNVFETKDADKFPIQALHKVWGDGGSKKYNRGVNSRNVYIAPEESVQYTLNKIPGTLKQKVMIMEAHGDLYTDIIPGIKKVPTKKGATNPNNPLLPVCPKWEQLTKSDSDYNKRVGGVACTRDQYGPGVYNILAYVPKTGDTDKDGRGYVFAIWPYNYAEIYSYTDKKDPGVVLYPPQYMQKTPCTGMCDGVVSPAPRCPVSSGPSCYNKKVNYNLDTFTVINHEIDIEIPCNSPQLAKDWKNNITWDTMNCNTWLTDTGNYDVRTGGYYTQVAVKKSGGGTFISDAPETDSNKDYHWYTLDWNVNNTDPTQNYVAFYFDDPFDPSDQTYFDGKKLPGKPSGQPLHKTTRFVPTRAGRLNFGPWMAWWGYGGKTGGVPNFKTAKVRLAHLSIIPSGQGFSFPQSYDQPGAECDFVDLYSQGSSPLPGPPTPPGPGPPPPGSGQHQQNLLWLWILLGVLGFISIVLIFVYSKKKNKKKKR